MPIVSNSAYHILKTVRGFREQYPEWVLPPAIDCLLFAQSELGESISAWLREKPEYLRNRSEFEPWQSEMADCLMMLISYCIASGINTFTPERTDDQLSCSMEEKTFVYVGWYITYALYREYLTGHENEYGKVIATDVSDAIMYILLIKEDWESLVRERLDKIGKKIDARRTKTNAR